MKYTCDKCGEEHEDWPALTYNTPYNYTTLTADDKEAIAQLDTDFCVIEYEDQTDRFIRCTLFQKVNGSCEDLNYGFWVSLSEKSFDDYCGNYNNENHITTYFGYLCNNISGYGSTLSIPTTVYTQTGNQRPVVIPHEDFNHPFVKDYYEGISKAEAERRIEEMVNNTKH